MGEKDGSAGRERERERESMQDIKGDIVFAGDTLRAIPYANIKHGPLCFAFYTLRGDK